MDYFNNGQSNTDIYIEKKLSFTKTHARPKSAMPRRGLRGSKSTSNRPQSAKPDSKRRCRAPTERMLGTDETTALENEYLIDGFDVGLIKCWANDIKSNYDGAQKESSKLCDLEQAWLVWRNKKISSCVEKTVAPKTETASCSQVGGK